MGPSGGVLERRFTEFRTTTRTTMSARSDSGELLSTGRGHGRHENGSKGQRGPYDPGVTQADDQHSDPRSACEQPAATGIIRSGRSQCPGRGRCRSGRARRRPGRP